MSALKRAAMVQTERTALLDQTDDSLRVGQLILLLWCRIAEPVTFFVAFPLLPSLVTELGGTDAAHSGFYVGLCESLFAFAQMTVVWRYGRASDLHGRRPIILLGTIGATITTLGFGTSRTFWQALLWRVLGGLASGNTVVVKCATLSRLS